MPRFTLKIHAENRQDHDIFQAIITLAGAALTDDWHIVAANSADIALVSFGPADTCTAWEAYTEQYPPDRLIAYTTQGAVHGATWHIQRPPEGMPRLSEVARVLNSVARHLGTADAAPQAKPAPPSIGINPTNRFHPQRHLAGILQDAMADGQGRICQMAGCPPVYLLPQENTVYTTADWAALSALCRADIARVEVATPPADELRRLVAQAGLKRRPLAEFYWFALLTGSNGRLLDGCAMDEPVHLGEWPGHVRLPFYAMYHDIATQMAAGMASLGEIARRSAAPLQNVIDFHNACACLGLTLRGEAGQRLARRKIEARKQLREALRPLFADGGHVKLLLAGNVGAGKTTALTSLSEIPPTLTEAAPSDAVADLKPTTTVAMEYGEIRGTGGKLQIYGTPGQRRFEFMGEILCAGAWGVLILIDNAGPDPLDELRYYLDIYATRLAVPNIAIGISHYDARQNPPLEAYEQFLRKQGHRFPVGAVDTRDLQSLAVLLSVMAENGATALDWAA